MPRTAINSTLKIIVEDELDIVRCSNCNKQLMKLFLDKKSGEVLYNIVVECPICSDRSWNTPVYGPLRYVPAEGITIRNSVTNDDGTVLFLTAKV